MPVFVTFEPADDEPVDTPSMRLGPYRYIRLGDDFLTVALGNALEDWVTLAVRFAEAGEVWWEVCGLEGGTRYGCVLVTPDVPEMREDQWVAEAGDEDE